MAQDTASLLVLVLDADPSGWGRAEEGDSKSNAMEIDDIDASATTSDRPPTFDEAFQSILIFINSFLLLHQFNQLAFIASTSTRSQYLFPPETNKATKVDSNNFSDVNAAITNNMAAFLNNCKADDASTNKQANIAGALSSGLCYINRMKREYPNIQPRVLVVQVLPDATSKYIAMMNAIFSAQKQGIPVDACALAGDSLFLQQATHLTSGLYHLHKAGTSLVQYLLSVFLPGPEARQHLKLPGHRSVDYRATCFCHRKIVDHGFVCPVCLSIYCHVPTSNQCLTCGIRFPVLVRRRKLRHAPAPK